MYTIMEPACPHCKRKLSSGADHRNCLFTMFDRNLIQSVEEWEAMCQPPKPKTIRKGRVLAYLPKE
jgi:hypothetical protein